MVKYNKIIEKAIDKDLIPGKILLSFIRAFEVLDKDKDITLFDIRKLESNTDTPYYRMKKGKYRAIFCFQDNDIFVDLIAKREECYKLWKRKRPH